MNFRIKTIIMGVAVLCLIVAIVLMSYTVRSKAVDADIAAQEISTLEMQAQEAKTINDLLEQSGEAAKSAEGFFVPSTEVVRYIETIEASARAAGVLITVDRVSDPREKPTGKAQPAEVAPIAPNSSLPFEASFTLSGSRSGIETFLASLPKLPYHLQINQLSLTAREGSTGWTGVLVLQAYMVDTQ